MEKCLLLIQQLYNQGSINDDQRDNLKGKCKVITVKDLMVGSGLPAIAESSI